MSVPGIKRPCLGCHRLTLAKRGRCASCQAYIDSMRPRAHYQGPWARIAAEQVTREPVCLFCGQGPGDPDNPLTADHINPRSLDAGTRTLCRRCNSREGGRLAQSRR